MATKYAVKQKIWLGGRRYEAGEEIELEEAQAKTLVRAGKIEAASPAKSKKQKPEGGAE
jgi:hypothetical protein